jgi:hypothetical protein
MPLERGAIIDNVVDFKLQCLGAWTSIDKNMASLMDLCVMHNTMLEHVAIGYWIQVLQVLRRGVGDWLDG